MFNHLIAETNGTRAVYARLTKDGMVEEIAEVTIPVIAWDAYGFALVANEEVGNLVRAADANVYDDGGKLCTFSGLDLQLVATGAW
jgi:hypothetical protein